MEREIANNLSGGEERHSRIDLEDVDSWLPESAQDSLSEIVAARGRRQFAGASGVDVVDTGSESLLAEWRDMPDAGKGYHLLKRLGLLEVSGADWSRGEDGAVDTLSDEKPVVGEDEEGGAGSTDVPHYY